MTIKKYLTWVAPATAEAFTHVEVWKSVDAGVNYTEFTASNDPAYGVAGIVITDTDAVDLIGASDHWYKIRFYDNVNHVYGDWSDAMRGSDFRGYCTITDIRNYTNVQSAEYSDAAVQMMIDTCTASIDLNTNRSWQGIVAATDIYLDGKGTNFMFIDNDIVAVTSLAIDDDDDGTYTSISASKFHVYPDKGAILLDKDAEVATFTNARRSVKISYTHGFADPDDAVRHLCILRVANMMKMDATRTNMIEEIMTGLRVNSFENTDVGSCDNSAY